jgi:hypothetical protein
MESLCAKKLDFPSMGNSINEERRKLSPDGFIQIRTPDMCVG